MNSNNSNNKGNDTRKMKYGHYLRLINSYVLSDDEFNQIKDERYIESNIYDVNDMEDNYDYIEEKDENENNEFYKFVEEYNMYIEKECEDLYEN